MSAGKKLELEGEGERKKCLRNSMESRDEKIQKIGKR